MRRATAVLAAGIMLLAFVGCGDSGGGGDEDAFCDDLEALSDQVADGDLASNAGLEDAVDRANDLIESAADGEQTDAVEAVGRALEDANADDAADTAETIQDELGDIADDVCGIDGDDFAIAPEETTTTTTADETTTTTDGGDDTTTTAGGDDESTEVNARQEIPDDFEADEDLAAAQACFDGDPAACDSLFLSTGVGTVAEEYGSTCGGRVADGTRGSCTDVITAPIPVPAEVEDTANAEACFAGDMAACDDEFRNADAGTPDQAYGGLCGGRVPDTSAFCVDIFGETAFL